MRICLEQMNLPAISSGAAGPGFSFGTLQAAGHETRKGISFPAAGGRERDPSQVYKDLLQQECVVGSQIDCNICDSDDNVIQSHDDNPFQERTILPLASDQQQDTYKNIPQGQIHRRHTKKYHK